MPISLVDSVISSLHSPHTRDSYRRGILAMYAFAGGKPITLEILTAWREDMKSRLSTATVNVRIAAVRSLIRAARRSGLATDSEAAQLLEISGVPARGTRSGKWLTVEQLKAVLAVPDRTTLLGLRNFCILAVLSGCALRVDELASLDVDRIQRRDGRWVIADLVGKGNRVRSVAIPDWVQTAIAAWQKASGISRGCLIRGTGENSRRLSTDRIRIIVRKMAIAAGVDPLSPHDLRRTCAQLCRKAGGDIEQIQFMLGHESIVTTQRYLGTRQDLVTAVNDNLGL